MAKNCSNSSNKNQSSNSSNNGGSNKSSNQNKNKNDIEAPAGALFNIPDPKTLYSKNANDEY